MQWGFILSIFLRPTFYINVLRATVPVTLPAIGEVIGERAGVVNIALEALIVLGAATSVYVGLRTGVLGLAILAGLAVGVLVGLIHAAIAVYLKGDQIVDGIGINMFADGFAIVSMAIAYGMYGTSPSLPPEVRVPGIYGISPFALAMIAIGIISWYALEKTKWGLRLRAVGEDPVAADAAGINVFVLRTIAAVIASVLAAAGGVFLGLDWLGACSKYVSAGRGFIALALVVFSRWNPFLALLGGLIFGFTYALSLSIPSGLVPDQVLYVLPYLVTLLIAAGFLGGARPPASCGKPYERI